MRELSNNRLTIKVNKKGAELSSVFCHKNNREYLWGADSAYWNRHSPVLFPIVGSLWNGVYRIGEKEYKMSQHGFARDMEFELLEEKQDKLLFRLLNSRATEAVYPYPFILEIGYELIENKLKISWTVKNESSEIIYFQIGGHPGFYYPNFNPSEQLKGYLDLGMNRFDYTLLGEKGCVSKNELKTMESSDGLFPLMSDSFDKQAWVIENKQISKLSVLDKEKQPYLAFSFDAPVLGIWSPPEKNAPFICIEPWYGRCDSVGYNGDFRDKEWMNQLDAGEKFDASYYIEVL